MLHHELTETIIGVFYDVYNELGHGFLESIYETAMVIALLEKGIHVETQVEIPVWFRGTDRQFLCGLISRSSRNRRAESI